MNEALPTPAEIRGLLRPHRPLLWLVGLGFFMQTLDSTIVNTALPGMAASLHESPLHMQSVVIAYMLAMAALIPASGWLVDRLGIRRVFLAAIALFTLGSLACALAPSLHWLVAARVLQGLGGALLLPVGRLAVLRTVPRGTFLEAISFIAIPGQVGPLLGPTLGGWLVQMFSWHWIFLINVPMGLLGLAVARRVLPADPAAPAERPPRFDLSGYCMLTAAMLSLSVSLDGLSALGLRRFTVALLMVAGLMLFILYWLHALRIPAPLYSPQLFRLHSFRVGILGNLFARIGSGALPYLVPLLLQVALGFPPAEAGMLMLPMALASIAVKRLASPLVHRFGYRRVLVTNTCALGLLLAALALLGTDTSRPALLLIMALAGAINSLQFTAMNTVTLKDLNAHEASSGNSLYSMVQMLAMSLGVSVAATLLATFQSSYGVAANTGADTLPAFRAACLCIGAITFCTAFIFWHLERDDHAA